MQTNQIDKKISTAVLLVSQSQIYQKKLFIFLCIVWAEVGFNALINPVIFTNPIFIQNGQISTQSNCCTLETNVKCQFQNDFTGTYEAGLFCQNRDIRMALQSVFALGTILGVLTLPLISDIRGKKIAFYMCLTCMFVGNLGLFTGILKKSYFLIGISQILSGYGSISASIVSYSINSDFFSDDRRQKAVMYYCVAWGLSDISILFVYYLVPYWMFYMVFLMLIPITALFLYFPTFFIESIHFLVHIKKDFKKAQQTLLKLSIQNKAEASSLKKAQQILKELEKIQKEQINVEKTVKQIISIIYRTPQYLKALICLIMLKTSQNSFYYGVQGSSERTGFNLGVSIFLLGLGQFTGYYSGTKFIPKFNRKAIIIATNSLLVITTLTFITSAVQQSPFLASLLLYVCFILSSYNFCAVSLVQTESFDSMIRTTSVGIEMGISSCIRLFLPFMIGILNERKIPPILGTSMLVLIFGIVPAILLKQTYGFTNQVQPKQMQLSENLLPTKQLNILQK